MTAIAMTPAPSAIQTLGFDRPAQVRAAIVTAAFVALFWELLGFIPNQLGSAAGTGKLVHMWLTEQDWSHGPLIPAFSAYLVHIHWDRIRRCPIRFAWLGLPILLAGLAMYGASVATIIPFAFAKPMAMMLTLLGVIVLLCGVPAMAYLWLPWMYLFFAIPMPKRLYFELTTPLRAMVAWVATKVLTFVPDLYIQHHGTVIQYDFKGRSGEIGVVDACSGMRSLIALCAIGVAVAFMTPRPTWQRLILVASCVPIAIFCNFIRVITTCVLHIFVDSAYAEGSYHTALGLVTLALGFVMFSALGWVLSNLTVPADDADEPGGTAARA
ncbi:MAG: exosortase/archaeosortase family protein [Phycisphaerales bacterium]|nr:exosortase/archaeosortase family protein [Phycisphaerales bacterium]